ncbi:transmembrane protein 216 isoform X1 [Poecile atricapillus]|uniref:transmembrane protein 216 isoform X1 n=1 Tax=Poecile atricapillus TaxID=48891 RepID=UPI002739B1A7|nr:transmembrane protein 216 isoform X1 [Poecile atricapillus]
MAPRGRHRSSAPLQVLLFLNGWYCATYFLLEAFVFVYKVLLLPYPVSNLVLDIVLLLLYLGIEATRIFFGSKGNLCQRKVPLSLSLALTVPAAVLAVYYLLLQTYSLRLEAFLSAILLLFYGLELLLGFLALLSFSRCRILGTGGPSTGAARNLLPQGFRLPFSHFPLHSLLPGHIPPTFPTLHSTWTPQSLSQLKSLGMWVPPGMLRCFQHLKAGLGSTGAHWRRKRVRDNRCRALPKSLPFPHYPKSHCRKATGALYKRLTTSSEFITQFQPIQRQI